ncbi:MAG TPA: Fe-S-binding domain-containing protein, partial [Vicinamibacteria bacterium]
IAVPGFNGFVGEFLILMGSWGQRVLIGAWSRWLVPLAALGVVLAAGYMLWMVQRVLYGEVTHEPNRSLPDLSARELVVLVPLVALALFMGVFSPYFTREIEPTVDALVLRVQDRVRESSQRTATAVDSRQSTERKQPGPGAGNE